MGEIVSLVEGALQYVTTKTSAVDLIESNRQRFEEDMKRNEASAKERAQREFAEIDNEIASLKSERDSLVNRRNGIASRFNESNGLFGDTQADENDLFGGENFLDENAAQREIDNINTQIRNIDAQIEKLESSKNRANEVMQGEIGGTNESDDFWNTAPTDEEVPFSIKDESTDDGVDNVKFSLKKPNYLNRYYRKHISDIKRLIYEKITKKQELIMEFLVTLCTYLTIQETNET